MRLYKKASGVPSIDYGQALEAALCWGFIDAQKRSLDDLSWIQRFCPRRSRSKWSKINRDKALALIAADKMQPSGLVQVQQAQADGRWDAAYDSPRNATVPDDLATALAADPKASAFFQALNAANRYAILYRVQTVKKAETRARRIRELVAVYPRRKAASMNVP